MGEVERRWRDHYNRTARSYDRKEWLWGVLLGYSDQGERRKLINRLQLRPGQRLLEVSVGTGANLVLAAPRLGPNGAMFGVDISIEMLRVCRDKLGRRRRDVHLVAGDAAHLPFKQDAFDAIIHFGAMSMFGDKKAAIDEMVRAAKPGARLVIGDVGVRPDRRHSLRTALVRRANERYSLRPPTELLPSEANDLHVTWFRNDTCYLMDFVKAYVN